MSECPKVLLAGFGHWGTNLARNLAALECLGVIVEADSSRLAAARVQYPRVSHSDDFQTAVGQPDVDAVVLATPAEQHYAMGMAALRAGKHLFVEKPLALDSEDGQAMVKAAREAGRVLMVGHLLQYHPAILKIQELLNDGVLGRIEYIYSNRLSMGKIRKEENALWSFAPHDISVILGLMKQMPVQVSAVGGAYLQPNIADVTVSHFLFQNGTRAHVFVSWLHPYKEQRLVIVGSKQMVAFEDSRPDHKLLLFDKQIEWTNDSIRAAKPQAQPVPFDAGEPLRLECEHFLDCVRQNRPARTPGEEGNRVLQVLQACQRSLQMNGDPVQLNGNGLRRVAAL